MKAVFKAYIGRLRDNCPKKTYIMWWFFRFGMILMAIHSLFNTDPNEETVTLEILMNMACMFIWEICMAMPKKNVFRYITPVLQTIITVGIFVAVVAGYIFDFYYRVRLWDSFMHFGCGILGVYFGYEITCALFKMEKRTASLTMTVIASMGFCLMCTTFWEIFEFSCDQILGLVSGSPNDVQHWSYARALAENSPKVQTIFDPIDMGRWPLMDTMGDIFLNVIGTILGGIGLKIYPYRHKGRFSLDFIREAI